MALIAPEKQGQRIRLREKMAEVELVNDVLHPQQVKAFKGTFAKHL